MKHYSILLLVTTCFLISIPPNVHAQINIGHGCHRPDMLSGSSQSDSLNVRVISNFHYLSSGMEAQGIDVEDSLVFVADWGHGLRIISVADPENPIEISSVDIDGNATEVEVVGDYAYVTYWGEGLKIFSLHDIYDPIQVGSYDSLHLEFVTISGNYAYISNWIGGPIQVLSIEDPSNPFEIGRYEGRDGIQNIAIDGQYAYCVFDMGGGHGGIYILDISDRTNPLHVGDEYLWNGTPWDVIPKGNNAYIAYEGGGLGVLSIENQDEPSEITYLRSGCFHRLDISDNEAYLVGHGRLSVISIYDPYNPEEIGYFHRTSGDAWDVFVDGTYIYVTYGPDGLFLFEYYGPTSIRDDGTLDSSLPNILTLDQNYPNPFNPSTNIHFSVSGKTGSKHYTTLKIHDVRGRLVKTLINEILTPGSYRVYWDGTNDRGDPVGSGSYISTLFSDGRSLSRKIVLLR